MSQNAEMCCEVAPAFVEIPLDPLEWPIAVPNLRKVATFAVRPIVAREHHQGVVINAERLQ
jgi:hypothetical protein